MKTIVITSNQIEGFHRYPNAPMEVDFLKSRHRHVFYVECGFNVKHDDRDIEIFMQQSEIRKYINNEFGIPAEFGNMSCEMIARNILTEFNCNYVKVTEDERGGAIIQR